VASEEGDVRVARGARLTYAEVADRIEQELGVRPALSTLRAAAADRRRGTTRTRLTAGMPAPAAPPRSGAPTLFSAAAIDRWLAKHQRRRIRMLQERVIAATPSHRTRVVRRAREAGLSWQEIADAINEADGTTHSRQWAQQRYR
jgi:hypothetical protein